MSSELELLYAAYADARSAEAAKEAVDALMGMHRIHRLAAAVVARGHDGRLVVTQVEGGDDGAVSIVAGFIGLLSVDRASELEERVVKELAGVPPDTLRWMRQALHPGCAGVFVMSTDTWAERLAIELSKGAVSVVRAVVGEGRVELEVGTRMESPERPGETV
jgi:uncharacterized membrane protein